MRMIYAKDPSNGGEPATSEGRLSKEDYRLSELETSMDNSVARDRAPAIRRERAKAPVHVRIIGDRIFNVVTFVLALFILALLFGLAIALIVSSSPAIRAFGLHFFVSS